MRKVLVFLLIAGLMLTASHAFADSTSEAGKQGSEAHLESKAPSTTILTGPLTKVLDTNCDDCDDSRDCSDGRDCSEGRDCSDSRDCSEGYNCSDSRECYKYYVGANRVDFGPSWYIGTVKVGDYDRLNGIQTIAQELDGLIGLGTPVTLTTRLCKDGFYEVSEINNLVYRSESGPPPWSGESKGKGK